MISRCWIGSGCVLLALSALACADGVAPSPACFTAVEPTLMASGGAFTPDVRQAYLDWAERSVIRDLRQGTVSVPSDCLAEVEKDPTLRSAVFGSVFPPDPSILQNYASVRTQMGAKFMSTYRSLAIAVAVARRTKGVESSAAAASKDFGRPYEPEFSDDEAVRGIGNESEKYFVRAVADYMASTKTSAKALYQDPAQQAKLTDYLRSKNVSPKLIGQIGANVDFGERLKNAMILIGQRPGARDRKPTLVDWLWHVVSTYEAKPASTPDGMGWPLFPLDKAPWPLLMSMARPVPFSEANYIWETYQGQHGPDRFHTYGPYRFENEAMPFELEPSRWFWNAWPDRTYHGGVCVSIARGTLDLYSSLCKPAVLADQPGHVNLISFQSVGDIWMAEIEQAFAGGPDVTGSQWYFDDVQACNTHYQDLFWWSTSEYSLGMALAMNLSADSYVDTRMATAIFRALPPDRKPVLGPKLLTSAISTNPFNPEPWYLASGIAETTAQGLALAQSSLGGNPAMLPGITANPSVDAFLKRQKPGPVNDCLAKYWRTLGQFTTNFAILSRPAPNSEQEMQGVYTLLKSAPGVSAEAQVAMMDKFLSTRVQNAKPDDLAFDKDLAAKGDLFGLLRMGQRYMNADGVQLDESQARKMFLEGARQRDLLSALAIDRFNPWIPAAELTVSASSTYSETQAARHLVEGPGIYGGFHDNSIPAATMWQTGYDPKPTSPANGLPPSPAWVRFDFAHPQRFDAVQIWNHNQANLTDRGFKKTRIYGTSDGAQWVRLTATDTIELPRAAGQPNSEAVTIPNAEAKRLFSSVVIAAELTDGNFGANCYGLSCVRFVSRPVAPVVPMTDIAVTASTTYSDTQNVRHLVDGTGLCGRYHDNSVPAATMWQTVVDSKLSTPANGIPASPAWVKFDFARPWQLSSIVIWNHNQTNLTNRGFRQTRLYGTSDGVIWFPLTDTPMVVLPRADGSLCSEPTAIRCSVPKKLIRSVVIAADPTDGNYGGDCYGLSAVRFKSDG